MHLIVGKRDIRFRIDMRQCLIHGRRGKHHLHDQRQRHRQQPITVSSRTGNGSATTPVTVKIMHTYKGDLKVDLVAPDGSVR